MNIDSNSKIAYLVDYNLFEEDSFLYFLETIDFLIKSYTVNPNNISFLVDESVNKLLTDPDVKISTQTRIKAVKDILTVLDLYETIDTKNYEEFKSFLDFKNQLKDYQLGFLTNDSEKAARMHQQDFDKVITIEHFNEEFQLEETDASTIKVAAPQMKVQFDEAYFTTEKDTFISITPTMEFDYVYSEKYGYLTLEQDNVMFGGEGKIYRTYENLLVKIYSVEERRYETVKKIQLLIDLDLRNKYIVWPKDIVYNNNEFIGYVMEEVKEAKGLDMFRIYSFLNLSYHDRFEVCLDLLKLIDYLHERDILIGDLKFDNILFQEKTKELYIIDSGSFQLEDYSCGVFNAAYTHDNLKGKNLRTVLRTLEEEYFPIYKILFEVLMGKGPFYDFKSGEVGSEVERKFHYPMEYAKTIRDRQNPLFFWVNGDKRLREVFNNYFSEGEILEVKDWIILLEDILQKGGN